MMFKDINHGLDRIFCKRETEADEWRYFYRGTEYATLDEAEADEWRYFYRGTEYATLDEAKAAVDALMGPDVIPAAIEAANTTDWGKKGSMTDTQRHVLYQLARALMERGGLGEKHMAGYEFKQFDITWGLSNSFYVVAEIGRKGDEGSMASIICRDRWHIAVGPRGGLTNMNAARYSKRRKGFHNCVNWGCTGFGRS
jgi:hypothetical protein